MAGLKIARLATTDADFEVAFQRVRHWSADADAQIEQRVAGIIADVRARGDAAVLEYTARFDGLAAAGMADLTLGPADFQAAFDTLPLAQRDALQAATDRVRSYHQAQLQACGLSWSYRDVEIGRASCRERVYSSV